MPSLRSFSPKVKPVVGLLDHEGAELLPRLPSGSVTASTV